MFAMNKTLAIAALLAAALLAGIFSATTAAVYADKDYDDDDHDDDGRDYDRNHDDDKRDGKDHDKDRYRGGDSSETNTEQSIKQKNLGGDGSSQFNCGENNIDSAEDGLVGLDIDLCGTLDVGVLDGGTPTPIPVS
jgi:hypothetical protein